MTIEERNQLIEDNYKLAAFFAHKYSNILPFYEFDELEAMALEQLVRAADRFDTGRGEFTTLCGKCVLWAFQRRATHDKCACRKATVYSLDAALYDDDDSAYDIYAYDHHDYAEDAENRIDFNRAMDLIPGERDKAILGLLSNGNTQTEVAKMYGISNRRIQQIQNRLLLKIRRAWGVA